MASEPLPAPSAFNNVRFPSMPEMALTLALLYQQLGGQLTITSFGSKFLGLPEPSFYELAGHQIPQLPMLSRMRSSTQPRSGVAPSSFSSFF